MGVKPRPKFKSKLGIGSRCVAVSKISRIVPSLLRAGGHVHDQTMDMMQNGGTKSHSQLPVLAGDMEVSPV